MTAHQKGCEMKRMFLVTRRQETKSRALRDKRARGNIGTIPQFDPVPPVIQLRPDVFVSIVNID